MASHASHLRIVDTAAELLPDAVPPVPREPASGPAAGLPPTVASHDPPPAHVLGGWTGRDAAGPGGAGAAVDAASSAQAAAATPGALSPSSWGQLFSDHGQFVAQVALRVLGRDDDVDDVVQEVFLTAMADIDKLRTPAAVRGWLKTVTVRKAYAVLRGRSRRKLWAFFGIGRGGRDGDLGGAVFEVPATGATPEDRALLLRIYRLLDELPASERLAWTLRYVEGEQVEAVAALCGCSLATAKRRIAAAQAFLERTLNDA